MYWDKDNPLWPAKATAVGERNESSSANLALREYALMGPKRSLEQLIRKWADVTDPPTRSIETLKTWSAHHLWVSRVKAWEVIQADREMAEWEEKRRKDKEARLRVLEGARGKIVQALAKLDTEHVMWNDVYNALRLIMQEIRIEYGDNVTRVDVTSGTKAVPTIREVVVQMPADVVQDTLAP